MPVIPLVSYVRTPVLQSITCGLCISNAQAPIWVVLLLPRNGKRAWEDFRSILVSHYIYY